MKNKLIHPFKSHSLTRFGIHIGTNVIIDVSSNAKHEKKKKLWLCCRERYAVCLSILSRQQVKQKKSAFIITSYIISFFIAAPIECCYFFLSFLPFILCFFFSANLSVMKAIEMRVTKEFQINQQQLLLI